MKVLIVGGVAGGASAAARLRRLDEHAEILMFERGEYISFANCGLPYYVGGAITDQSELTLQTPESFNSRFRVDVRPLSEVTRIDPAAKTVTVRDLRANRTYEESYDRLILSPGAEPVVPPIPGVESERVFTLRNIPDTFRIKEAIEARRCKSIVVVGGGYIGIEMAENLRLAGLAVTVVELADHIIAPLDADVAAHAQNYLREQGVSLLLENAVTAVREDADGLTVSLTHGEVKADLLLLSVGVRPETTLARDSGLALGGRGCIAVDEHMRTSDESIYAVGDAVEVTDFVSGVKSFVPLAGPANKQGRIAADNLCGIPSVYRGTQGSSVLKLFDRTVACTGVNEQAARARHLDYDVVFNYSASHAGYYPGGEMILIKTLFDPASGRVLGAQLFGGEGVDKRCDVLATAIRAGMTGPDLARLELCYAPPYSSAKDPVNMVGFVIENTLSGLVKNFQWHQVDGLPRDGSVTLLDVRSPGEYARGHVDGFINIPLDALRGRIGELDPAKPVYAHCFSGLRSYVACRILTGNGFHCYNLSGSYVVYDAIRRDRAARQST